MSEVASGVTKVITRFIEKVSAAIYMLLGYLLFITYMAMKNLSMNSLSGQLIEPSKEVILANITILILKARLEIGCDCVQGYVRLTFCSLLILHSYGTLGMPREWRYR